MEEDTGKEFVESVITSGNLIKADLIRNIGFFNDNLFIDYVDYDFCCRIIENDLFIMKVNNAILIHNLGDTMRKKFLWKDVEYTNHSYIRRYYISRNRFYVWNKYKHIAPNFIYNDKKESLEEIIKILLFENNKILKLKMIIKGYIDFKNNIYGKLNLQ